MIFAIVLKIVSSVTIFFIIVFLLFNPVNSPEITSIQKRFLTFTVEIAMPFFLKK